MHGCTRQQPQLPEPRLPRRPKLALPPHCYLLDRNRLVKYSLATRATSAFAIVAGTGQAARKLAHCRAANAWLVFAESGGAGGGAVAGWALLRPDQTSPAYQQGAHECVSMGALLVCRG